MQLTVSEKIAKKWAPLLEHKAFSEIKDNYRKNVTAILLENQEQYLREASPANNIGNSASQTSGGTVASGISTWDPILINLVRRSAPNLIAYDICGVQPMTGPTGLIFAMRAKYGAQSGEEAFMLEADTAAGGSGATSGYAGKGFTGGFNWNAADVNRTVDADPLGLRTGPTRGYTTAAGEALGDTAANGFSQMAFTIEKTVVEAKTRALKAEYSLELQQDLKAIHGLDAETELANILSTEILAEINREVVRTIYTVAKTGCRAGTTQTAGVFDVSVDSNGRWSAEKFKGLIFQIERESNQIAKETRRGKGNFVLCSSDVASALAHSGMLDYAPALSTALQVDDTGNTFVGTLNGRIKVYIDPYATLTKDFFCVGYKGSSAYDAGIFYCPYVPLQMVRAVGQDSFQPKIGFKTRYGLVSNPFVYNGATPDGQNLTSNLNQYYRIARVDNLF
jgi:hypothetical protein